MSLRVWALLFSVVLTSSGFAADSPSASSASTSASLDFANGLYARKMYAPAITEYKKFLEANPGSSEAASARFRYADSFYFTKDYASAIAHFELFLKSFPTDKRASMAEFRLATARFYQGGTRRAIRLFRKLSRTAEEPAAKSGSVYYLAKALENKGKGDRALRILQKLAATDKASEYASYAGVAIGDFYLKGNNYAEAVSGYRIAADNGNPPELARQARFKVAELLFSLKNYTEASIYYQRVLDEAAAEDALLEFQKKNRESLRGKSFLGIFYCDYNRQDLDTAEHRYASLRPALENSAYRADILFLLAALYEEKGRPDDALAKLEEVLADPDADPALKEKATFKKITVLSSKGKKDESLQELEKHFAGGAQKSEAALLEKSKLLAEIGKTDEAIANYQKLIADFPASETAKTALFQVATAEFKAKRTDAARQDFKKFADKYPGDPYADLALLQIVQIDLDAQNFKEAFEAAESFIQTHASSQYLDIAYYKLGVAATGLKRFNHAGFAFNKVLEKFPESKLYAESLYGAAISLENGKRLDQALPLYESLLQKYPDNPLTQEVWGRLGYLYIQANQVEKARAFYEDLIFNRTQIKFDPDGVFWLIQYSLDHGDYDFLNKMLEAMPARFPQEDLKHQILFFKGESAMGKKEYAAAADFYKQAIDERAEGAYVAQAHLGLGIARAAMDDAAGAEQEFNEALRYDSELRVAMRARFELANLRLKAQDLEAAAKAFMLVAILYDDPKYTPPALYKAGECFRALQRPDEAEKAFTELKARYPESDWARKA